MSGAIRLKGASSGYIDIIAPDSGANTTLNLGTIPAEDSSGDLSTGNITTTGYLRGPSTFTIDPAAHGDSTGTVRILGGLIVEGTTTTINSTTLTVDDLNITLASGAADAATADGAGITVDGASATLTYNSTPDAWSFNKNLGIGTSVPNRTLTINQTPPTALGSPMLQVGEATFVASGYYGIGLGYTAASYTNPPTEIAAVSTSSSGGTTAELVFATRNVTTDTAPTERMRIAADGRITLKARTDFDDILIGTGAGKYVQVTGSSGNAWTISSSGGTSTPGTASTSFGLHHWNGSAWSEKFTVGTDGNVGIGTASTSAIRFSSVTPTANHIAAQIENSNTADSFGLVVKGGNDANDYAADFRKRDNTNIMRIRGDGNVGIGTTNPVAKLHINGTGDLLRLTSTNSSSGGAQIDLMHFSPSPANGDIHGMINFGGYYSGTTQAYGSSIRGVWNGVAAREGQIHFYTRKGSSFTEKARIDEDGHFFVGTTDTTLYLNSGSGNGGIALSMPAAGAGRIDVARAGNLHTLNRLASDGEMMEFYKDGSNVGKITTRSGQFAIGCLGTGLEFNDSNDAIIPFSPNANNTRDNALDLGLSSVRFDDVYATNGTIQTSDRNEKQDIEELTEAEQRVAVAAKALMRKFRWKSSVVENGENARIHYGIIAQDLQAAFAAEGLDAGNYAMFINTTWTDEESGKERSRMGVRYSELLAFIIAAI